MRVHTEPTGLFSPAMRRISRALEAHLPAGVTVVKNRADADLAVLYVISHDAIRLTENLLSSGKQYAIVQCCLNTSGSKDCTSWWIPAWQRARAVWSYFDLRQLARENSIRFLHAPLGVDAVFRMGASPSRNGRVMTSGHVSGLGCEAIEPVWQAAQDLDIHVTHTGATHVGGITKKYPNVSFVGHLSDEMLAEQYRHASWVAALRHIEGFELPAAEGLLCGAHPILFDQPTTRYWYGGLATYVADTTDYDSIRCQLIDVFQTAPQVSDAQRTLAGAIFNWRSYVTKFWSMILGSQI